MSTPEEKIKSAAENIQKMKAQSAVPVATANVSYADWSEQTVNAFLDLADIADGTARRNALVAMKMTEEKLNARFNLCKAALDLDFEYATTIGDTDGLAYVAKYRAKMAAIKAFIGMK
jgi:hypothetical protein